MANGDTADRITLEQTRTALTIVCLVRRCRNILCAACRAIHPRKVAKFTPRGMGMVYSDRFFRRLPNARLIGTAALQPGYDQRIVRMFFFKLARALAVFYLLVLLKTLLLQPFSPMQGIELFTVFNYWLSPIQSFVVAAITVLFTSHKNTTRTVHPSHDWG